MQEHIIAKSIAETFLAAKILKAIENTIAKKETISVINNDSISLEDYLFEDYNFELINTNVLNNLIIIDYKGNILNFIGKKFITESEVINFRNKSNTTIRIGYALDINNVKQITNTVAGIPQVIEISGQLSSNDITIKEGDRSNEIKIYDTKTGNYVASVKLVIPEKLKPLIKTVYERVKKIFSTDIKYKSPAYIIGLIGSFIIAPVYSKIKNLLKPKQENYLYFENDTNINDEPNSNEQKKINGLINKITTFVSKFFKNTGKILKAFVQFTIALFKNIKVMAIKALITILQVFNELFYLFIFSLVAFIDVHIALFVWPVAKSLKILTSKIKIPFIVKIVEAIDRIATSSIKRIELLNLWVNELKPLINDLKLSIKKTQIDLEKNLKILKDLTNKEDAQRSSYEIREVIRNIIKKNINNMIYYNIDALVSKQFAIQELNIKNKLVLKDYLKLCEVVKDNINQIAKIFTPEFKAEIKKYDYLQNDLNSEIYLSINKITVRIHEIKSKLANEMNNDEEFKTIMDKILSNYSIIINTLQEMYVH